MTFADSAPLALEITAAVAAVALFTRVLTKDGVVAAFVVGACVSLGFGLPGLAVLGTFFVVGTAATRIGWEKKKERGTAEAGEGRRDWKRVLGKGGVAAVVALTSSFGSRAFGDLPASALCGAVAAALADTLGTEIGTMADGRPRSLPFFRVAPTGTAGAVSFVGTLAAAAGAAVVATVAWSLRVLNDGGLACAVAAVGLIASLLESRAVGRGLRAPGFVRNLLTTLIGALASRVTSVL